MEETKPIKRSKELAPLSREHHDGLLFVWKIKQGLANGTSAETLSEYTKWFWTNHIKPHFKDEEEVLVKFLAADNTLVKRMLKEHAEIRDYIIALDKEPDFTSLKQLAELINDHIRFEERQLFAYAEENLTQEQLEEIYKDLPQELQCSTDPMAIGWKDEFWVKK